MEVKVVGRAGLRPMLMRVLAERPSKSRESVLPSSASSPCVPITILSLCDSRGGLDRRRAVGGEGCPRITVGLIGVCGVPGEKTRRRSEKDEFTLKLKRSLGEQVEEVEEEELEEAVAGLQLGEKGARANWGVVMKAIGPGEMCVVRWCMSLVWVLGMAGPGLLASGDGHASFLL